MQNSRLFDLGMVSLIPHEVWTSFNAEKRRAYSNYKVCAMDQIDTIVDISMAVARRHFALDQISSLITGAEHTTYHMLTLQTSFCL
jgi:hypothetical protein